MLWRGILENAPILDVTMEPITLYANLNCKRGQWRRCSSVAESLPRLFHASIQSLVLGEAKTKRSSWKAG